LQHSLLEVFSGLGGLAVVVTGAALATSGAVDPGVLPLLTLLAMAAFLPVSEIAQVGRQLADTLGAARRIYALRKRAGAGDRRAGRARRAHGRRVAGRSSHASFTYPGQSPRAAAARYQRFAESPAGNDPWRLVRNVGRRKTTTAQLLIALLGPR